MLEPTAPSKTPTIALLGAGPRGASLLERIGANLDEFAHAGELEIHVIDDAEHGAGRVWRTDQTRELCMNTLSHAVTLFTEPSGSQAGPVAPGPTLYEWSVLVRRNAAIEPSADGRTGEDTGAPSIPRAHAAAFAAAAPRPGLAEEYREELAATVPESHPSRALYGEYIRWCFDRAVAQLPPRVRVIRHRTRAVDSRRDRVCERLALADGSTLVADVVIAATGWLARRETPAELRLGAALTHRPELVWVRPESPVNQDLERIPADARAIVRGLGMGFFDTMALLTIGRGGRFEPDAASRSGLRYLPSGDEPVLHATSRRGVPFRAKSLYRALPPRSEQRFLRAIDWGTAARPIDFDHALWPRIVADAAFDHYATLHRVRPEAFTSPFARVAEAITAILEVLLDPASQTRIEQLADLGDEQFSDRAGAAAWLAEVPRRLDEAVAALVPNAADRFDLLAEMQPASRRFDGPASYDAWVAERVEHDLEEAELAWDSPRKAGLWSLSAARGVVARIGSFGGFDAESRASGLAMLFAVGGMVGSGPPAFRNRQLLALADAGLVHFIGPEATVEVRAEGFVARSPLVTGSEVAASTLIDAWMHSHHATESADPLVNSLIRQGRIRSFHVASRHGGSVATGGIDIDPGSGLLIGESGALDRAIHFAGIPVDETLHDTIISPMPGTDPTMLRETDRVARSALGLAFSREAPTSSR